MPVLPVGTKSTIKFVVGLKPDGSGGNESARNHVAKIIDWYTTYGNSFDATDFVVKHVSGNTFEITCTPEGREFAEMIVDPDDDGNHPLKIGNSSYLVVGEILTVNGKSVDDDESEGSGRRKKSRKTRRRHHKAGRKTRARKTRGRRA